MVIESAQTTVTLLTKSPVILAYIGPDQIMPITSVLSAIVGVALMFWNRIVGFVARTWAGIARRSQPSQAPPAHPSQPGSPD